jgi:hypothetical protein
MRMTRTGDPLYKAALLREQLEQPAGVAYFGGSSGCGEYCKCRQTKVVVVGGGIEQPLPTER